MTYAVDVEHGRVVDAGGEYHSWSPFTGPTGLDAWEGLVRRSGVGEMTLLPPVEQLCHGITTGTVCSDDPSMVQEAYGLDSSQRSTVIY